MPGLRGCVTCGNWSVAVTTGEGWVSTGILRARGRGQGLHAGATGGKRCAGTSGQSPEDHRETFVRSVPGGPVPLGAAFRQAGRFGQGGSGRGKGGAHCGTDSGVFGIKGLAACIYFAFTDSSPPATAVAPTPASPAPMARFLRGRKGAGERRTGDTGTVGQGNGP
jgi:hypothetical protein